MIRGAASIKALRNPWLYGAEKPGKEKAEKKPIDFVGLRKRFLTISTCLMAAIVLCACLLYTSGKNFLPCAIELLSGGKTNEFHQV